MYECMYEKVGYVHSQAFKLEETFYINLIYNWGVSVAEIIYHREPKCCSALVKEASLQGTGVNTEIHTYIICENK